MAFLELRDQADLSSMEEGAKRAVQITLEEEPQVRTSLKGETFVRFVGREDGAEKPLMALFRVPDALASQQNASDPLDQSLRELGGGDRLSLAGQWIQHSWKGAAGAEHSTWEFRAQIFEKGDHSLDRMVARMKDVSAPQQDDRALTGRAAAFANQHRGNGR